MTALAAALAVVVLLLAAAVALLVVVVRQFHIELVRAQQAAARPPYAAPAEQTSGVRLIDPTTIRGPWPVRQEPPRE